MAEEAHAKLGPSGAVRWTVCEGSVQAEEGKPDRTSIYAAAGTLYHTIIAECLSLGLEPDSYLGREFTVEGYKFLFDESWAGPMRDAIDRVMELSAGGELFVETRVDISPYTLPGQFGTCDIGIIFREALRMIVWDNKWGEGVAVTAFENLQCILYVLGLWHSIAEKMFAGVDPHDVKVTIMIDQPRARVHAVGDEEEDDHEGLGAEEPVEKFTEWHTTIGELLDEWAPWFRERAEATTWADAPRTPGVKQCQFCKAKTDCRDRTKWFLEMARMGFEDVNAMAQTGTLLKKVPTDPRSLTIEERIVIAENRGPFIAWLREVHDSVLDDYMRGYDTPGIKAIRGRKGPRQWADEKRLEKVLKKALGVKAYVQKLISPTKAEEVLPAEVWEKVNTPADIVQSDGKPTLVSEHDPRAAIMNHRDGFETIDPATVRS